MENSQLLELCKDLGIDLRDVASRQYTRLITEKDDFAAICRDLDKLIVEEPGGEDTILRALKVLSGERGELAPELKQLRLLMFPLKLDRELAELRRRIDASRDAEGVPQHAAIYIKHFIRIAGEYMDQQLLYPTVPDFQQWLIGELVTDEMTPAARNRVGALLMKVFEEMVEAGRRKERERRKPRRRRDRH